MATKKNELFPIDLKRVT